MGDIVLRVERNEKYKTISTHAVEDDGDLSWKAVGILTYLVSRPDGWEFFKRDIVSRHTDGKTAVTSGLKELREAGYLYTCSTRAEDGTFKGQTWYVSEVPRKKGEWERRSSENPHNSSVSTGTGKSESRIIRQTENRGDTNKKNVTNENTNHTTPTFASDGSVPSDAKEGEAIQGSVEPHRRFLSPTAVEADGYPEPFERTWRAYPHPDRKQPGGKPAAYRYWWLALKRAPHATPELLHAAMLAYREGHTGDYRQNFATFFNGRDDDYNWRTWLGHEVDGDTAPFARRSRNA